MKKLILFLILLIPLSASALENEDCQFQDKLGTPITAVLVSCQDRLIEFTGRNAQLDPSVFIGDFRGDIKDLDQSQPITQTLDFYIDFVGLNLQWDRIPKQKCNQHHFEAQIGEIATGAKLAPSKRPPDPGYRQLLRVEPFSLDTDGQYHLATVVEQFKRGLCVYDPSTDLYHFAKDAHYFTGFHTPFVRVELSVGQMVTDGLLSIEPLLDLNNFWHSFSLVPLPLQDIFEDMTDGYTALGWIELDDNEDDQSGAVKTYLNGFQMEADFPNVYLLFKIFDLSGYNELSLNFDVIADSPFTDISIFIQFSNDGGTTWTTVDKLNDPGPKIVNMSGFIGPETGIRFVLQPTSPLPLFTIKFINIILKVPQP